VVFESFTGEGGKEVLEKIVAICREAGMEEPRPRLIYFDLATSRGLVRCGHKQVDLIKKKIRSDRIRILGVSGTIRAAKRKFLSSSPAS